MFESGIVRPTVYGMERDGDVQELKCRPRGPNELDKWAASAKKCDATEEPDNHCQPCGLHNRRVVWHRPDWQPKHAT